MANRSKVPKFGNWENGENMPYTVYFDKARKERTGTKMMNPNDPEDNPDLFSSQISPPRARPEAEGLAVNGGNRPGSGGRRNYSIEKSPLHHQARGNNVSPAYETVKNNSTPGRSRLGGELDKGSTLPKFGEWDENNPASADGYTHIFNKVREEKHGGQTNGNARSPYRPAAAAAKTNQYPRSCCFPWSRK